jgi:prepilin-type N-terminal cleavage/methylation domain-containing protein
MLMINKGFTLVELLIAIFVSSLIMAAVYGAVNMAQHTSSSIERRVIAQQDVRGALDLMALEIRMASYSQRLNNIIWLDKTCGASANQNYKGIQEATANSITIEMDIDGVNGIGSGIIGDSPNEIITYTYNAADLDLRITRQTNCLGVPASFIGGPSASGSSPAVRVINGDPLVNVPVFRYYDFNNNLIQPINLPALIPNIRTIEISLVVETENVDPTLPPNTRKRLVYSTRVTPRNHGSSAHY